MVAAVLGGAGWSGRPNLHFLALLYPFLYLQSRTRFETLSAVAYQAAATWAVVPGSAAFFRSNSDFVLPVLLWSALIICGAAPWILFYSRLFLPISALAALTVSSIPPLGLMTVAHPLAAAGAWFPGTRWFGLAFPLVLIAGNRRLGHLASIAALVAVSVATHARFHRPGSDSAIVAINTEFGANRGRDLSPSATKAQELSIQRLALGHPGKLVILPEAILPNWSPAHETRWASTFAVLRAQHTGVLIGTTLPIPNTEANRNVLLSRGFSDRLSYVQRVPVPLGMWYPGDVRHGFPLMLRFPSTIRIWGRRAGVLVCYEQLIPWPALQTLAHNPELLIAPSNLYWASKTNIPAIQHRTAQDWADLWAIPLYEPSNR